MRLLAVRFLLYLTSLAMSPFDLWIEGLEWDNEEIIMSNTEKQDKIDKFKRLQDELKQLLTRVPKESAGWFYQKAF